MTDPAPWVFIVDDDLFIRTALARLLRSAGLQAATFPSAAAFLKYRRPNAPSCLVVDVQMPELGGLELQHRMLERRVALPIVFVMGHSDIAMTVRAVKAGAVDVLPKPVDDETLLRAVRQAIAQDARAREGQSDTFALRQRMATLSPREREVFEHVVSGALNKQIGRCLGVTEKTIKAHRGQVMRKMKAGSLAELVRMAGRLGIQGPSDSQGRGHQELCLSH